jgi:hypothetical protein
MTYLKNIQPNIIEGLMRQKPILPPIHRDLLEAELNEQRFIRNTNKGNHQIFIVNHHNAPNVMQEIGRLRELTFSESGGGTGNEVDIDTFDTSPHCYEQLIVYSPEDREITGGYRFLDCSKILDKNLPDLGMSTRHYFNFSDQFIQQYLPYTIELGRSWVQPQFQPAVNPRKGIFALDNLWDGLGAITIDYPHIRYFFGKVTMYTQYHTEARDAVLAFMKYFFEDKEHLVTPIKPLPIHTDLTLFLQEIKGKPFKDALKILGTFVRERGEHIPPLINNYMQLSPTMKAFGTALNPDFGGVEETGILVTLADIYEEKKNRHVLTYQPRQFGSNND